MDNYIKYAYIYQATPTWLQTCWTMYLYYYYKEHTFRFPSNILRTPVSATSPDMMKLMLDLVPEPFFIPVYTDNW